MKWLFAIVLGWTVSCQSQARVEFGNYKASEFMPAQGQVFEIPFRLDRKTTVEVALYSSDGDLVRRLSSGKPLEPGVHSLAWDGKDDRGQVVPDEAYVPVLQTGTGKKAERLDPRQSTGGEALEDLHAEITSGKDIAYTVPAPSRILIRVGVKGGPMLRSLANWVPKSPGKNIQRWDGKDADGILDIRDLKDLTVLVTGFKLPQHTIIATGNRILDYSGYRKARHWPDIRIPQEAQILERGGVRLSKQYYAPRYQDIDAKVRTELPASLPRNASGWPVIKADETVPVKVDIAPEHRWLMDESLYEVAFFIDQQFASEEEQGYLPLTWHWKANGLAPGKHLLTVNISGFGGRIGISNLLFEVPQ